MLWEHAGSLTVRKTCIITGFLGSACRKAMCDSGHKIKNANKYKLLQEIPTDHTKHLH